MGKLIRALVGPPEPVRLEAGQVELFGIPFSGLDLAGFLEQVFSRLRQGERGIALFTPDAWAVSRAILEPELADLYRRADLVACDGAGVAFAARSLGAPLPWVPGADLAWALCVRAREEGRSVYLLGGRPGVAARAAAHLTRRLPGLVLAGWHHGYFSGAGPVDELRRLRPDLVFVGMGFPKQERWILGNLGCGAGFLMGVGGTLDFWAGRVPRAPLPLRKWGLEWLWRAAVQPHRVRRLWCVPFLLYQTLIAKLKV